MVAADLILKNGTIVTQNDSRDVLQNGAIAIGDGRILAIGLSHNITSAYQAARVIDLKNQIVFPGLVNTHTHCFQVSTKGLGEDMPVQEWVTAVTAPTAIMIKPDEMYWFCLSSCLELIHSGVTTMVDMSYRAMEYDLHVENIRALKNSGLRTRYTSIISDFGLDYGIPAELIMPIEWFLDQYSNLLDQFPANDRFSVGLAIGAPWTITDKGLVAALDFSVSRDVTMSMHIAENEIDNQLCQQRHGKNIVPYLDEVGFLSPNLLAVHCVDTDEIDIGLYAKNDVKVSYNPVSNMYLGSGFAPVVEMANAGIAISIGVDGAGSNNSQDMIETLKVAALLPKVKAKDASVIDAQTVLDWATRGGARVLGLENEIGSLEVGKKADLFVMNPKTAKMTPVHDPVASLIYSSGQQNVVMTIADGEILLKDGIIQSFDEEEVLNTCQIMATQLADRCGSNGKITRVWRPGGIDERI